jgi:F-type H+-transporting ATPase subunit gamma
MPALIDLRRRIKSVRNTQQITQAMKTVSTAKFKKAQRGVLEARPYWHALPPLLRRTILWKGDIRHPLIEKRSELKAIVVVLTSDKGLCGAFNSSLLARASEYCQEKSKTCKLRMVLIGKKAMTFFRRFPYLVEKEYAGRTQDITTSDLRELVRFLIREYSLLRTDAVYVWYNEFRSILAPRITLYKLLPVEESPEESEEEKGSGKPEHVSAGLQPDWEPQAEPSLELLLPLYVENEITHFFSESLAAEHAARMMAMENATLNAEDLIEDLTLMSNKIRQTAITKELLEIMTAVEALAKR